MLAKALPGNPAWTAYRIFAGEKFLGSQMSVPTLGDCEWHARTLGRYAEAVTSAVYGWTAQALARRRAAA